MTPKLKTDLKVTTKSIAKLRDPRSDVVLIPSYTEDGKFGYFIAHELAFVGDEKEWDRFEYEEMMYSADYNHAVTLFKQATE